MSLIATIKARNLAARKSRDVAVSAPLTTFIGEAEMIGKNAGREVTDAEVVALLKKFIKNVDENIKLTSQDHLGQPQIVSPDLVAERDLYAEFLPKQLSEDDLKRVIAVLVLDIGNGKPKMGDVIKQLKADYEGQYDGALASKLIKEQLQ